MTTARLRTDRYDRARHGVHNFARPDVLADPTRYVDALAELDSVFYDEVGRMWVCTGYEEAVQILTRHRTFSSVRGAPREERARRGPRGGQRMLQMVTDQALFSDPPEHTELRGLMHDYFTRARVRAHDGLLGRIVESALNRLPETGQVDLVSEFAGRMSVALGGELLGLGDRQDELTAWADAYGTLLGSLSSLPDVRDTGVIPVLEQALTALRAEVSTRMDESEPRDLLGHMATGMCAAAASAADVDRRLDIVAANGVLLVGGGYQTLSHLVSTGLVLLARHPGQRDKLIADRSLIDSAVDEFMRLDGSSQYLARRVTEDTVVGGKQLSAGQTVLVHVAAANLDPTRFAEPRKLDIERRSNKHLGFSAGRHYCIGAPYAERLAQKAILGFLDRYPDYEVNEDVDEAWSGHPNTRCRVRCPVIVSFRPADPPTQEPAFPGSKPDSALPAPSDWNHTATPLGPLRCWHEHVERHAAHSPDQIAVLTSAGRQYTYGDIDRRANAVAHHLRSLGIEPGTVVGIGMERSVDLVIAVLAVAKAGAAFLLFETTAPAERVRMTLDDAGARWVLADTAPRDAETARWETDGRRTVLGIPDGTAERAPQSGVGPGDAAYVVCTSGTTGRPKAIAITHDGLVNLHVAQRQVVRLHSADRVLQFFSLNFDGCIWDLSLALMSGATLVVAPLAELAPGPGLVRLAARTAVTVMTLTPSVWDALPVDDLPALRVAAAAGEVLPPSVVSRWRRAGRRFLNLYGPAEAAVWTTWHECTDEAGYPIGRPVANKRVHVLDESGEPVPVGTSGELCIGGFGLGRYLGRPELMEERFLPDRFGPEPGRLLYRTGDICRWLPSGELEFVGRRDRQVKIRGQRVELDEVEALLSTVEGVRSAMVRMVGGALHATVASTTVDEPTVRARLAQLLHSGMTPQSITIVPELPRDGAGKTDRRGTDALAVPPAASPLEPMPETRLLPLPEQTGSCEERERTTTVWRAAKLFAFALDIPQAEVRTESDFFSLGGDSLSTATLLGQIEEKFHVAVETNDFLLEPTPVGVASLVDRGRADD
ncbi:amino acid adenylation domain-containing protein [Amycolatopsis vastitatis]|uniref:Nonribosomal peptide synthetase anabaenopeptin synthetase AptA2 n=1 Tax=Amycolatopsis vastitatis TaxID=1905142 RepID=A0A229SKG7_9PSEU|nr:amino acid adenylation domain-containing protein [Amycolatopsis vastitatis]OXM59343.1 nonribosomal peptide synthetase anabaenopeptin synthetase AptA2 [Amycolatopsis vastitatis]